MLSVCSSTKLELSKKLLLIENYQCFRLCNFSGRSVYVYEIFIVIIVNQQNPLFRYQDTETLGIWSSLLLFKYVRFALYCQI